MDEKKEKDYLKWQKKSRLTMSNERNLLLASEI